MRIKGLIRRLEQLQKKYGNVEVLTLRQGEYGVPKPYWLKDGGLWNLKINQDEFKEKYPIAI